MDFRYDQARELPNHLSLFCRIVLGFPVQQRELPNSFSLFPEDCSWISDATNKTAVKQCHGFRRCVVWISDASKRDAKFYTAFAALFLDFRYSQERTAVVVVLLFDALMTPQSQYIQFTTCSALLHACAGTTSGRDLLSDNLGLSTGRDLQSDNLGLSVLSPPLRGQASSLGCLVLVSNKHTHHHVRKSRHLPAAKKHKLKQAYPIKGCYGLKLHTELHHSHHMTSLSALSQQAAAP